MDTKSIGKTLCMPAFFNGLGEKVFGLKTIYRPDKLPPLIRISTRGFMLADFVVPSDDPDLRKRGGRLIPSLRSIQEQTAKVVHREENAVRPARPRVRVSFCEALRLDAVSAKNGFTSLCGDFRSFPDKSGFV
ncbi:MAG: hypothetical protein K8F27_12825 [Sulfuricellaceae bacterium]|nr:hypothetical protein [Sulfuricellaceae bacterium]